MWKPAPSTPLTAVAVTKIMADVLESNGAPAGVLTLVTDEAPVGKAMAEDRRLPLISFTGSTPVGKAVGVTVQVRVEWESVGESGSGSGGKGMEELTVISYNVWFSNMAQEDR